MRKITWNKKVAASRGESWKKALVEGKLKAKMNPTKLQLARANKQIPQIKAATDLGVSLATYGAIERARRPVSKATAKKVSSYFGKSEKSFFKPYAKGRLVAK